MLSCFSLARASLFFFGDLSGINLPWPLLVVFPGEAWVAPSSEAGLDGEAATGSVLAPLRFSPRPGTSRSVYNAYI